MKKKKTTIYLTLESDEWLKKQAESAGIPKTTYLQILINGHMEKSDHLEKPSL